MSDPTISTKSEQVLKTDDKIYSITRVVALIVVPFLWLAFLILYFFPDLTGERFAWAIKPHMTSLYLGAGYLGGSWLFINAIFGKRWHRIQGGFLPITAFTWIMMISTFLHWDRFAVGKLGFTLWVILYVITPFLVPALWFFNRKTDSGELETIDVAIPPLVSPIFKFTALGALIFVGVGFLNPEFVINIWPWTLSVLTARVMCGWIALLGVGMFTMSNETRWSGWKVPIESIVIWHFLVLVAIAMNSADFKTSLINWYTLLVGVMMIGILIFYPIMEMRKRKAK
ncbi:MAG: hypothetical protein ACK2U1_07915 [Anaerolineales bacterium]